MKSSSLDPGVRDDPPDVILLDVEMPGIDGFQVLRALKSEDELKDIPVVFLTSRSDIDDVVAGLRGGAHDYLKKPFEHVELLARVGWPFTSRSFRTSSDNAMSNWIG